MKKSYIRRILTTKENRGMWKRVEVQGVQKNVMRKRKNKRAHSEYKFSEEENFN